nr:ribonuclease H-like domain-containing protein [Tanacetum cinerariifolium]
MAGSDNDSDNASIYNEAPNNQQQPNIQPQIITTGVWIIDIQVSKDNSRVIVPTGRYIVPTGRVIVATGRYVVPTGRVIVPTGRYIVPTGRIIVAIGRYVVPVVKARFGGNAESKKMRKSMLKQEFLEFRIREEEGLHKGYDMMQKILSQLNQLKAKPDAEDINLKFLRALPSSWSQKARRKIDFDKKESARFNKKKVRCYKCQQSGHFARECKAKGGNDKQRYSSFKIKEIGKKEEDSKALITVDTLVDWTNHDSESDGVIAAKEFGMIAGYESENAIKEGAAKLYNLITRVNTTGDAQEFALMGVTSERVLQRNQLSLEDMIRVLSIELENTSNLLKHSKRINADVETAKKDLQIKLDNHLAQTEKPIFHRFAKTDSMKAVPPPLSRDYTSLSDHIDLDESQMSYGTKSSTSCDSKSVSNDFVSCDDSDKSSEFVPQAILLSTGKVHIPPVRPQPVPTRKPKVTPVPTGKPKVTPVPTGKPHVSTPVPTGRPNRPFPVPTDRGYSPSVVLENHIEKVFTGYPRTMVDLIHLHTDDNVADLLTKAFDGPRYVVLTGRVIVPIVRYIVPTGRVIVATGSSGELPTWVMMNPSSMFTGVESTCPTTAIDHFDELTRKIWLNGAHVGYNCPAQVPSFQTLLSFPQQYPSCEDCGGLPEADHCQPPQYTINHLIFNAHNDLLNSQTKLMEQITYMCEMVGQFIQKKHEEEQANDARYWKIPACFDDDDDYNLAVTPNEPVDSLSMGDEHLNTIPETKSDEFIKSSVENVVPNPSESEVKNKCDVPACFTTFSNILFDADFEYDSSDDQSLYDEDVPEKIFSNPLFEEEIIPMKIDQHHDNAESDLVESLRTRDSSLIISSKFDSLLDEFAGELTLLKSIPPGIHETDCDPENEIRLIERLLYDNSSPRPPEEFVFNNYDTKIESFSPSPILVKDSDSLMEEIELSFTPDDPMPPGIEEDDYDSERDILILEELFNNYSLSLPENESFHFDIPSFSRPPAKPPDGNTRILNIKMMGDISEQKDFLDCDDSRALSFCPSFTRASHPSFWESKSKLFSFTDLLDVVSELLSSFSEQVFCMTTKSPFNEPTFNAGIGFE